MNKIVSTISCAYLSEFTSLKMTSEYARGMLSRLSSSVLPTLMISVSYIDIGKWVAAVDGGAHFGFELVFVVLLFNCIAIMCQYLSTCIGTATRKDLAEVCTEEYSRVPCILLGVQAELSIIISDITMILGVAHGLNLLSGMDIFACICCAVICIILLPSLLNALDDCNAEALCFVVSAFTLFVYVFGVLISQPEVPLTTGGILPKFSGESAYSLMALLGANIMPHNFYIHSSIVKKQKRQENVAIGSVLHDNFFAILFVFTGIILVNYVLMNSSAAVFGNADTMFNFEDISVLMDQIFRSPIAPLAFFLVLLLSSQITTLMHNIGGQVIMQCFFNLELSFVHHSIIKYLTIIPVLYYAKNFGSEGTYQLLLYCQVILAALLPSSVIPLFRTASSKFVMKAFKVSSQIEILALIAFLVMFASNLFLLIDMLFGSHSWINNPAGTSESFAFIPYTILLIILFASIGFTLHLAVTPLKSASNGLDTQMWSSRNLHEEMPDLSEAREDDNLDEVKFNEIEESSVDDNTFEKSVESQPEKSVQEFNYDIPERTLDSYHESQLLEESKSVDESCSVDTSDKASSAASEYERTEAKDFIMKVKENKVNAINEHVESYKGVPLSTSEIPDSTDSISTKSRGSESLDGFNGSGSLSKLSGLGRAARRQFAAILDEFWGNLFDFHGKLTQEASANRLDVLLGLASNKSDGIGTEASKNLYSDTSNLNSPRQNKINSGVELPYGSWSQNTQPFNSHAQNLSNLVNPNVRLYSSMHMPQYSENRDYQPATIHGYQLASYLRENNQTRAPYTSSISLNRPPPGYSPSSISNLRDQVLYARAQNEINSLGSPNSKNPTIPRMSTLHAGAPSFEPSFNEPRESTITSINAKKYHSSPDISAIIALGRSAYLNEAAKPSIPLQPSQFLNMSRQGVPLGFDHLSPPKLHQDLFGLNPDTRSIWAKQPYEQLFRVVGNNGQRGSDGRVIERPNKETFTYAESGAKLLQSLRVCILKLLKLEGSDWLIKQNGGSDELLIDNIAASEKFLYKGDSSDIDQFGLYNCGDSCVWRASLVVSFGVWCIRRVLELSLVESRPELWGKYTFVLNRLQGILEPAFSKPRQPPPPCPCLETSPEDAKSFSALLQNGRITKSATNANAILDIIKDIEIAVSGRKGRTGTAAGDIAFPKGKENLASVLKRYKRRLSGKNFEHAASLRRLPSSSSSSSAMI